MNDVTSRHRKLSERLYVRTESEHQIWTTGTWSGDYETSVGNYIVSIKANVKEFDEVDYGIVISDKKHTEIDRFWDEEISEPDVKPSVGDFRNHYALMKDLYRKAQRQTSGADKALESILNELDEL
ncbi:hypothetical protein [Brevundimonas lutea]|uniref:hypothetical protein n=1 Tax=Brevundimonas lutea TaxID=2293980 RepID=UPI0013CEAFD7|nr:hypothetical protein [Brevundimonas lutea]